MCLRTEYNDFYKPFRVNQMPEKKEKPNTLVNLPHTESSHYQVTLLPNFLKLSKHSWDLESISHFMPNILISTLLLLILSSMSSPLMSENTT
jgi:hypothetical protein